MKNFEQRRNASRKSSRNGAPHPNVMTQPVVSGPTEEEIRRRAHEIFMSRNGAPGDPVDDWLQAERELRAAAAQHVARRA